MVPVRKGELTAAQIDRDWPYQVEIPVPPLGLGGRLNDLHAEASTVDAEYRTRSRTDGAEHFIRFCFRSSRAATDFRVRSGGSPV